MYSSNWQRESYIQFLVRLREENKGSSYLELYMGFVLEWTKILLVVTAENVVEKVQRDNGLLVSEFGTAENVCEITVHDRYLSLELLRAFVDIDTVFQVTT